LAEWIELYAGKPKKGDTPPIPSFPPSPYPAVTVARRGAIEAYLPGLKNMAITPNQFRLWGVMTDAVSGQAGTPEFSRG
jgi:hypothetical protein